MPLWIKEKLFQKSQLIKHLRDCGVDNPEKKVFFSDHHLSHAASAFYPSPFNSSAILTMDGVGEWLRWEEEVIRRKMRWAGHIMRRGDERRTKD